MNFNIIAYCLYFLATALIIIVVGFKLYKDGAVYLNDLYPTNLALAASLNNMLLIGYYLLNLGYAAFSLHTWPSVFSFSETLGLVTHKIGSICLILGSIHFLNMLWVRFLNRVTNF